MIVETFISQLRANAPIFAGRIAGAAEFIAGLRNYNANMLLPAAYVVPQSQDAERNDVLNGLIQVVHKVIGIVVELDASTDRRGQAPVSLFDTVEAQLFASVLGLYIGECRMSRPVSFLGGRYLDLDRARLFWQWDFGIDWQITDADGVQPVTLPFENIEVDIFKAPVAPGDMPAAVVQIPTGDDPVPPTDGPWPDPTRRTPS